MFLIILFSLFINIIQAEEISGPCAYGGSRKDCQWTFNTETKLFVVSGTNGMPYYKTNDNDDNIGRPFWKYKDDVETAIIEDGITELSTSSFESFSNLKTMRLGKDVQKFNRKTFHFCYKLENIIVDENNQISDYTLYVLGIRDFAEIEEYMKHAIDAHLSGKEMTYEIPASEYTFDEIYSFEFKVMLDSDHYIIDSGKIRKLDSSVSSDKEILDQRLEDAMQLKIVGILRPKDDSMNMANIGTIGYMSQLMIDVIENMEAGAEAYRERKGIYENLKN